MGWVLWPYLPISVRSLTVAWWGTGWWVPWPGQCINCMWSREVLCEADWEKKSIVPWPSGALQHAAAYSQSSGTQCKNAWDDYAWSLWIFGHYNVLVFQQQFLWMVSTEPLGVWSEYANPLMACLLGVAHNMDGSRLSQSLVGDVLTTELLFVAYWNSWHHLQSSSWFAAYSLSFHCWRWWGPSKLFFVGMKCFCNVQLTGNYRHSDAWFN